MRSLLCLVSLFIGRFVCERFRPLDGLINRVAIFVVDNDCPGNRLVDFIVSNDLQAPNPRYADFFYLHHCRTSIEGVTQLINSVRSLSAFARHSGRNFFAFSSVFPEQSEVPLYPHFSRADFTLYHMLERLETDMGQWRAVNPQSQIDSFRFHVSDPAPSLADIAGRSRIPVQVVQTVDSFNIPEWGNADIHLLFESLAGLINCETSDSNAILVDAGANIGRISKSMLDIFPNCTEIVSVEPLPQNIEQLKKIGTSETGETDHRFHLVEGGLSAQSGNLTFQHECNLIDDIARIVFQNEPIRGYEDVRLGGCSSTFPVYSVVDLMNSVIGEQKWTDIFLLKLDLEGHDAEVIKGAYDLFARRKIKFVSFEFTMPWLSDKHSLEYAIRKLWSVGYFCFWITNENLVPVSAWFFHRGLELRRWTNFFCGHHQDDDLQKILVAFNQDPVHLRLYDAFANTINGF